MQEKEHELVIEIRISQRENSIGKILRFLFEIPYFFIYHHQDADLVERFMNQ